MPSVIPCPAPRTVEFLKNTKQALDAAPKSTAQAPSPEQPYFVDATSNDPLYDKPIITSRRHVTSPTQLYIVSGHFQGTQIHFNFYYPPREAFRGRFWQYVYPTQSADASDTDIIAAAQAGAYTVQCTGAMGYRHEAAGAKLSRDIAGEYYGVSPKSIYGYVYGGSGGSYVTFGAVENTDGVWQGAVPFVNACPNSIPYAMCTVALAKLVLKDKLQDIADAVSPGGNGDVYANLSDLETTVLKELLLLGLPARCFEFLGYTSQAAELPMFRRHLRLMDPTYEDDFWTKPGYVGCEESQLGDYFRGLRHRGSVPITDVQTHPNGVTFRIPDLADDLFLDMADFFISDGESEHSLEGAVNYAGKTFTVSHGDGSGTIPVKAGHLLRYDNSYHLALHMAYRHQIPRRPDFDMYNHLRHPDGTPRYPQRDIEWGPIMAAAPSGKGTQTGKFSVKMIVVDNMLDMDAFPLNGHWYRRQVQRVLGGREDQQFRLWYNDHANHFIEHERADPKVHVVYNGMLYQALKYAADWVERDMAPPESTSYSLENGQVVIPRTATERRGIQPVATLTAGGSDCITVEVGTEVEFTATAQVPNSVGSVIAADWDGEGSGKSWTSVALAAPQSSLSIRLKYTYPAPGTYFPSIRVGSSKEGWMEEKYALALNRGRMRVVVTDTSRA